jgi:ferredoxin-nitrite reductase
VAILRLFQENGCRTNRKKARLKYLLEDWGLEKFATELLAIGPASLKRGGWDGLVSGNAVDRGAHVGLHPQKGSDLFYGGVAVPVGLLSSEQLKGLAHLARDLGDGELRLTVWQNLILSGIEGHLREAFLAGVGALGLGAHPGLGGSGVVACTGNTGCKFAASDTKGHALGLIQMMGSRVWRHPFNVHFTGCSHSCAQHLIGDIGLIATKVGDAGIEGYHMVVGGGSERDRAVAKPFAPNVVADAVAPLVMKILDCYAADTGEAVSLTQYLRETDLNKLAERVGVGAALSESKT